jgi:hypothetical protein
MADGMLGVEARPPLRRKERAMDKKIIGLVGAVAIIAAPEAAQAMSDAPAVHPVLEVQSYSNLLDPIPNAAELLRTVDMTAPSQPGPRNYQTAQNYHHHHHHHHHHNSSSTTVVTPVGSVTIHSGKSHHHHHHQNND